MWVGDMVTGANKKKTLWGSQSEDGKRLVLKSRQGEEWHSGQINEILTTFLQCWIGNLGVILNCGRVSLEWI